MANNFITNNKEHKTLKSRIKTLITGSDQLKFLVGYFYFSGWKELVNSLREKEGITLKLLVGLQVDKFLHQIVEHGRQEEHLSQDEKFQKFMDSLGFAINNEEMDTEEFYNQVEFFLEMIEKEHLIIRKTENPNHAKLYLFQYEQRQQEFTSKKGQFITGSSNLTRAGLEGQQEFNVEISDYGYEEAEQYFEELWARAVPITEDIDRRMFMIEFVKYKSQAATVTPFEAYSLILKTYLELQDHKHIRPEIERLLEENGFKRYSYQIDAVNQATSIINEYGGVIIADVVGLGKSVIASLIAKNLGKRGMILCPPGLIGDKNENTGWWEYINRFKLYDWEIESRGKLQELSESMQKNDRDLEVIIVDEAHSFRNQDTEDYESLANICRNKLVILLTATPFNNSPADIFSLLKLFIVPGKSGITLEENLEGLFRSYEYRFKQLADITKNYKSKSPSKRQKAEKAYLHLFGNKPPVDIALVRKETQKLANMIKEIISPIVIRRNRLDLREDIQYRGEIGELSKVQDPCELFFRLDPEQSEFYDRIVNKYFGEEGDFTGAIYQPFVYEEIVDEDNVDEEGNRALQQQRNLYEFMRRLLVKRFESSFGSFVKSLERFINVHQVVLKFIENSDGRYILDRKLMEIVYEKTEEEIEVALMEFEEKLKEKNIPKNNKIYTIKNFKRKDEFLNNIQHDLNLLSSIAKEAATLKLTSNDPKREAVAEEIATLLKKYPDRKIILFSEYVDTVHHLEVFFKERFRNRVLICDGLVNKSMNKILNQNFNGQFKEEDSSNDYDILISSDRLSEGYNLNRAGVIINYDIPWNPTRVIQRLGRINRIGRKIFNELFIYNLFPSEKGADIVKSREIASQKMFLIHNSLGEDTKIFHADEEPSPSTLFTKLQQNPEETEELNVATIIRNKYHDILEHHPDVIEKISTLPARVKSAKNFESHNINVVRQKGLSLFAQQVNAGEEKTEVTTIPMETLLPHIECKKEEKLLKLSEKFWNHYRMIKEYKPMQLKASSTELSIETKAHNNLKAALKILDVREEGLRNFIQLIIKDLREYHTLPKYTLRRLATVEVKTGMKSEEQKKFYDELRWVRNHIGENYLEQLLKKVESQRLETIIAVENRMD